MQTCPTRHFYKTLQPHCNSTATALQQHCNTLQHFATRSEYGILQLWYHCNTRSKAFTTWQRRPDIPAKTLQQATTHCSSTAAHYQRSRHVPPDILETTLQQAATHCISTATHYQRPSPPDSADTSPLNTSATSLHNHCNALQHTATHCNSLQHTIKSLHPTVQTPGTADMSPSTPSSTSPDDKFENCGRSWTLEDFNMPVQGRTVSSKPPSPLSCSFDAI